MNTELLKGFHLGSLLIEPLKGQVIGPAGSVHLPPKAAEVLVALASKPGEVVSRADLLATVWGPAQASQEALSHAVSELRHALDDHPDDPRFIQTLPRRGYRLIVPPRLPADGQPAGGASARAADDVGWIQNLKQRGVIQTGIAYLVLGWLVIQVTDIVFSQLHLPPWAGTFVTVLVIAGFPIALVLSWYLEFRDGRAVPHDESPASSQQSFSRTYVAVIGALSIAGVLVFIYDRTVGLPSATTVIEDPERYLPQVKAGSIAVLPFTNIDGSEITRVFADGLVDDVITRLSRVPGLRVASRGDSHTLQPSSSSRVVRNRLRVAHYLEGSVQFERDQLRIIVQLIDSSTGFHVLSRTFDRPSEDFFEIRDEITELTVANVRVALPAAPAQMSPVTSGDPDIDVYMLYRRGVAASRQQDIEASIGEALRWFDAALEIDPGYAAAYAGKCAAYVEAYPFTHDSEDIDLAESACAMALDLNPNLDVVYTSLGNLRTRTGDLERAEDAYAAALDIDPNNTSAMIGLGEVYRLQGHLKEAEASLRKAIGLHPGDWEAYNALGTFLFRTGRYREAAEQYRVMISLDDSSARAYTNLASALTLAEDFEAAEPAFRRALELEPSAQTYANLGMLLYNLGRYENAVGTLEKAVEMQPRDYLMHSNLGDALRAADRRAAARDVFSTAKELAEEAQNVNPNDPFLLMDLAWINTVLGDRRAAQELIRRALATVPDDPYVHYIHGLILNESGEIQAAIESLETAVARGYSPRLLVGDPNLRNLEDNPRFNALFELSD